MHERRILVPLDGSDAAQIVLPYAAEIAAKLGSEIILISVSESTALDIDNLYSSYLESIKKKVQSQLKEYGARETSKLHSDILLGKPADEILRYADASDAGLILMASRSSLGQGPWLLGNIAAKVLRATGRPVLLIRESANPEALQQKRLVRRILMPLDGSNVGEAAIPYTEVLARALGAELVLFQVVEPGATWAILGSDSLYDTAEEVQSRKVSAIAYLDGVSKQLKERGLSTWSEIDIGSPADQIIDYAKANAIDLIAMSTHGRTGIGRWVFGCVTDKVLHAGDTAVLVVPASQGRGSTG
jgi:nucleotide-binding universal stress UspA family protein